MENVQSQLDQHKELVHKEKLKLRVDVANEVAKQKAEETEVRDLYKWIDEIIAEVKVSVESLPCSSFNNYSQTSFTDHYFQRKKNGRQYNHSMSRPKQNLF